MKIVLLSDVPKLGRKSEVKNVSPGYAKNFLFPRGLAMVLTSTAVLELEQQSVAKRKQAEDELVHSQVLAQKLDGLEIEIAIKASKDGVGYAAVSAQKIAETLQNLGFVGWWLNSFKIWMNWLIPELPTNLSFSILSTTRWDSPCFRTPMHAFWNETVVSKSNWPSSSKITTFPSCFAFKIMG